MSTTVCDQTSNWTANNLMRRQECGKVSLPRRGDALRSRQLRVSAGNPRQADYLLWPVPPGQEFDDLLGVLLANAGDIAERTAASLLGEDRGPLPAGLG